MRLRDFQLDDRIPEELVSFSSRLLEEIDQASSGILVDALDERLDNPLDETATNSDSAGPVGVFVFTRALLKLATEQHPYWLDAFNKHRISIIINFSRSDAGMMQALSLVVFDRSPARALKRSAFFAVDAQKLLVSENSSKLFEACRIALSEVSESPQEEGFCCFVDFDYARQHEGTLAPWYYVRDSHIFAFDRASKYAHDLKKLFSALSTSILDLDSHEHDLASAFGAMADQPLLQRHQQETEQ